MWPEKQSCARSLHRIFMIECGLARAVGFAFRARSCSTTVRLRCKIAQAGLAYRFLCVVPSSAILAKRGFSRDWRLGGALPSGLSGKRWQTWFNQTEQHGWLCCLLAVHILSTEALRLERRRGRLTRAC